MAFSPALTVVLLVMAFGARLSRHLRKELHRLVRLLDYPTCTDGPAVCEGVCRQASQLHLSKKLHLLVRLLPPHEHCCCVVCDGAWLQPFGYVSKVHSLVRCLAFRHALCCAACGLSTASARGHIAMRDRSAFLLALMLRRLGCVGTRPIGCILARSISPNEAF